MGLRDKLSADARRDADAIRNFDAALHRLREEYGVEERPPVDGSHLSGGLMTGLLVGSGPPEQPAPASIRAAHQDKILADFQDAEQANDGAQRVLGEAQQLAAQTALALVEARKRMRRVAEGVI